MNAPHDKTTTAANDSASTRMATSSRMLAIYSQVRGAIKSRYQALNDREKSFVHVAAVLLTLALVWWVMVSPALQILKKAPAQHLLLDQEIQAMQKMATEVKVIQSEPKETISNFETSLKAVSENLLPSQTSMVQTNDNLTITIKQVSASNLARWLEALRTELHVKPNQVQLKFQNDQWHGTIVIQLPTHKK